MLNVQMGCGSGSNTVRLSSPWGNTPLEWCCSPGWKVTQVGSSASCHSRFQFCPRTETVLSSWPPAAWPPSSSLWHRRSGSGKWLPLAPPYGTSSSQSLQRSGLTLLESWRRQTRGQFNPITSNHLFFNQVQSVCWSAEYYTCKNVSG